MDGTLDDLLSQARQEDAAGRPDEALRLIERAADVARQHHPDLWPLTQYELASLHERRDRVDEAERVYRSLLSWQEAEGAPERVSTLEMLAELLGRLGKIAEARQLFERSIETQIALVGSYHPEIANSYRDLARCLQGAGHLREAEDAYRQMIAIRDRYHGKTGAAVVPALLEVARFYVETERPVEAIALYRRALESGTSLPADTRRAQLLEPALQDVRRELAAVLRRINRVDEADALEHEARERDEIRPN